MKIESIAVTCVNGNDMLGEVSITWRPATDGVREHYQVVVLSPYDDGVDRDVVYLDRAEVVALHGVLSAVVGVK